MGRREINIYTKLDKNEESYKIMAIIYKDVIKYIDLANNKMIIDMNNDIITRENMEYKFDIDLKNNSINIYAKKLRKEFNKKIETLLIDKNNREYLVRYRLVDDDMVNEYFVKFKK